MKPAYVEAKNDNMFSKLQEQQQQQQQQHPFPHGFQLVSSQPSEEDNSRTSGGRTPTITTKSGKPNEGGDGASIEVVRRPRGRPPGSKNKPKLPVIITRDTEPAMSPCILEVPSGKDIVEAISHFCRRKNTGLCVLSGSGTVANVTLRQPSTTPGASVTFHGRFDILSISATFLAPATSSAMPNGLTISLAGPQGQIVGGLVAGALISAGAVYLVAASFNSPSFHRLPDEDDQMNNNNNAVSGGGEGRSPSVSAGGEGGNTQAESCGISMYSCHLPSDVIWAPVARQPQPPPF